MPAITTSRWPTTDKKENSPANANASLLISEDLPSPSPASDLPTHLPADINPALLPVMGDGAKSSIYTDIDVLLHLEEPNPWDFLETYKQPYYNVYRSAAAKVINGPQTPETVRLTSFPLEVVYCIAKTLPPESAACLALVNKTFHDILSNRFLKVYGIHLWRLLVLIEKDLTYLVACANCLKLHSPAVKWDEEVEAVVCLDNAGAFSLPSTIIPPIVRSIAKAHLQNRNYSEFLGYVNRSTTHNHEHMQSDESISCRIINGNLFVRNQVVLRPLRGDIMTMRSLWELHRVLDSPYFIQQLCNHKNWDGASSVNLQIHVNKIVDCHNKAHHNNNGNTYVSQQHTASCFSTKDAVEVLGSSGLKTGMTKTLQYALFSKKAHGRVGKVRGCKQCFTDYSVSYVDIDGVGRCLVLTTWKDLGGVGLDQASKWNSHQVNTMWDDRRRGSMLSNTDRGTEGLGQIYCAWEGIDPVHVDFESDHYVPKLGRRVLANLKKAAVAHCNNESSEHETDGSDEAEEHES